MGREDPPRGLAGIRIVAFTQFLLGPVGAQYLSDLGADVVKVENPHAGAWERSWAGGDAFVEGVSAFFLLSHRNVRSVALDLKRPAGRAAALRLIEHADVVIENFRPGVMESLGLGYDDVRGGNPSLVYASASGFGADSPFRALPGQDLLMQALTGLTAATGSAEQAPVAAGAPVVDQHAAALLAMGVLAALVHRERTGEGQHVAVNMLQAGLDLQTEPVTYHLNGSRIAATQEPLGSAFHAAPYGLYPTRDGHVAVSLSTVAALRAALDGAPELEPFEDPALAISQRDAIYRALAGVLAPWGTEELVAKLRAAGVWCAPVNDYDAVFADDAVRAVDPVVELDHPEAGPIKLLRHPISYSALDTSVRTPPPALGQHTREALAEVGCSEQQLAELTDSGVTP
ncbi:CaiB/BaiF CoA-transferase family protein [Conexibacter sp. CPCC 206217]|uniref:CaiB/BaiF CoA transferase family protein n=1 Tax=Conexibacter sp. CPCC 206217 TaxID=3064574 RepID=UPI00272255B5|nr:CoA transferase [Conexibacter sp. CPCC 206217]MDO8208933.1 CoA transferase [Conexibacter sp. CPCC 206217]